MGKRKAERTEGAAPPKRSLRSRKPKTAGDEHGTPTGNHQEAALIQSQDSDKTDSNSQNALVSELVQQGHADPTDSITNNDPSKPDCSGPGETIPTCGEDSDRINSKSHNALWGPTEEQGVRGHESTITGPPEAQGNKTPFCEAADRDPVRSAWSAQLVHPPSTMATNQLIHPPSTMETGPLAHPSSTIETGQLVISQTKVPDHHIATPTHPSKQSEDTEASAGGGCHDMEAQGESGGGSGCLTPAQGEEKGSTEAKLGESLEVGEEEEEGGVMAGPQAETETKRVSTEEEKKEGADVSTTMKEEEEKEEEQALNKTEEEEVVSSTREDEEERSGDRGEEDAPQVKPEEDNKSQKQKDEEVVSQKQREEEEASRKQKDEEVVSQKQREEEEASRKQKDEDEASQNRGASAKDEEESSQGGDDGAAVATGGVALSDAHRPPKRKRMGMRRRMGMGRPSEKEKKTPVDGQTSASGSEREKRTLVEAQTSASGEVMSGEGGDGDERMGMGRPSKKERKTPADGQTSEKEKTPADGQTSEKEKKTPADGQTSDKEKKTPADGQTSGRRSVGGEEGGGRGVNEDEGEVERERKCGMAVEEKNSVSEMEGARGEVEREKNEGMMETDRNSIAEMDEGGGEMEREKSEGAMVEEKNVVGEIEREERETEKKKRVTENDRQVVVAEEERAVPLATAPSDAPSEVEEEQQYERHDNGNPGDKEQAAMTTDDGSRMLVHSAEVTEELDHNSTDAREEQRATALQGLESASIPLLTSDQMEAQQVTPLEVHSHAELQPEPVASSSAPTPPSTSITAPATKKSTDGGEELSTDDHTNTVASMTTVSRDDVLGGPQEVEEDAVMSCAVSEGLASPPDIKSPHRDTAMAVNDPHRDTVAPRNDHDMGSVAPSMDHKRDTAGSGSSSHSGHDVATAPPEDDMSNSSGVRESSLTSEVRGHDPETSPDVSTELRCPHDDLFDPCDPSSFNMVSDSQLNDLISVMEMEDQRGPESFGVAEDATELVCGLITELSSLNRSIMAAHRELESLRRGNRTARTPQRRPLAQRRPDATPPSSSSLTGQ